MTEIPGSWATVLLGDAVSVLSTSGHVVETSEYSSGGSVPVLTQGTAATDGFTNDSGRAILGDEALIVFGDHTRSIKLGRPPFAVGPNTKVLLASSAIDPRFLFYQLPLILPLSRGYGRHFQYLKKATLVVAPRREQARIVDAVEEQFSRLDAGLTALDRVRQNLKRMRSAVLDAAVTGRLVERDPLDEPSHELLARLLSQRRQYLAQHPYTGSMREPNSPETSGLPELPPTWCWATVDQLCLRVADGVHKKPTYVAQGIPFVTVRNLTAGPGISFEHLNYVTPEDHAEFVRRTRPERGDLLLSKDGTLGVVRAIRDDREFSIFVSVALIKPVDHALTDYLELALSSPVVQQQMVSKGSGLQHIHLEDLRQDCIPIPPLDEQRRITGEAKRQLSLLDAIEADFYRWGAHIAALRSSILAAAFAGTLVPQDATDEPASALLNRIATVRAASTGQNPAGSRKQRTKVTA